MEKRTIFTALLIILTITALFTVFRPRKVIVTEISEGSHTEAVRQDSSITMTIDDGTDVSTYSGIRASNAFQALTKVAEDHNIPLDTKTYDFGIFVASINGKRSGSSRAWIYFVNGSSGRVAADKYQLKDGDSVSWRYMVPE